MRAVTTIALLTVLALAFVSVSAVQTQAERRKHHKVHDRFHLARRDVPDLDLPATPPDWCKDRAEVVKRTTNLPAGNPTSGGDYKTRCSFYWQCVEPLYKCGTDNSNPNSYPANYGYKYCKRFISATRTKMSSTLGKTFIDVTLPCLQLKLYDRIYGAEMAKKPKDCAELTQYAFDTHPDCYTQINKGGSICQLARPSFSDGGVTGRASDIMKIAGTVDGSDLLSVRSFKQMGEVIEKCTGQVFHYAVDAVEHVVESAGHTIVDATKSAVSAVGSAASRAWNWIMF